MYANPRGAPPIFRVGKGYRAMELQPLYYQTVWWMPLLVFLVALVFWHALLVYSPWRLTTRAWKKVGYVWLTMSVISILSIASQSRQIINTNFIPSASDRVKYAASNVLGAMHDATLLSCKKWFADTQVEDQKYCDYVNELEKNLSPTLNAGSPVEHDFAKDQTYPLAYGYYNQPRLEINVKNYNKSIQELNDIKANAQRSDSEMILIVLAPFLLSIALALRMTKVTADLRPPISDPDP